MIKFNLCTLVSVLLMLFVTNTVNGQDGSFRVRSDNYIQIGYDVYKALTFGESQGTSSLNNGAWGLEYWDN